MRVCVSAYVCVSFHQVEDALRIYCLFYTPFNKNIFHSQLFLCKNPRNESPLVAKNEKFKKNVGAFTPITILEH